MGSSSGKGTTVEVLAFLGLFGLLWAGLQTAALERQQLRGLHWSPEVMGGPRYPHACSLPNCYSLGLVGTVLLL